MALNLYRRHRRDCEAGRAEDSTSGEFAERARGWKRCACVIFVSGTLAGHFRRKRTGATTWDEARAFWEAAISGARWFDPRPWEEIAKVHEHRRRDLPAARALVEAALTRGRQHRAPEHILASFTHRLDRLTRRLTPKS